MTEKNNDGIGMLPNAVALRLAGASIPRPMLMEAHHILIPRTSHELDLAVQVNELYNIKRSADRIEALFQKKNLPLPTVYAIHTAGIPVPFAHEVLGRYSEDEPFELLPPTDIMGHSGTVSVAKIDEAHTYLAFEGREHPYERQSKPYDHIINARRLRVVKELIRRQRERGENPVLITMYLSGVVDGHPLKPGDLGIIMDDTELGPSTHPGTGAHGIFDKWIGERFQPKAARSSNVNLARAFYLLCREHHVPIGPVAIVGTAGATEFESFMETAQSASAFELAKRLGLAKLAEKVTGKANSLNDWMKQQLQRIIHTLDESTTFVKALQVFPKMSQNFQHLESARPKPPSLTFGMGNTAELAVIREKLSRKSPLKTLPDYGEDDVINLGITLITDSVGEGSSEVVNHSDVVAKAFSTAPKNEVVLREFIRRIASNEIEIAQPSRVPDWATPFSLQQSMYREATLMEEETEERFFADTTDPKVFADVLSYFMRLVSHENGIAILYSRWEYPDIAEHHEYEAQRLEDLFQNLSEDGLRAYEELRTLRDSHVRGAEARKERLMNYNNRSPFEQANNTVEILQSAFDWHLKRAKLLEKLASLVASEKGISHEKITLQED